WRHQSFRARVLAVASSGTGENGGARPSGAARRNVDRVLAGHPIGNLPSEIVMPAPEMVDAALAGLDLGEVVTIPSLPELSDWQAYERARQALTPKLSLAHAAA